MDPAELESICRPVVDEEVEYVKGNRLRHPSARFVIPKVRLIANYILSVLTRICSGYWHVSDFQSGYTAISKYALNVISLYKIYPSYCVPNDILGKLNMAGCRIREVNIKPIYHVGEQSKMNKSRVFRHFYWLLFVMFVTRIWGKYFFHPLFFLYYLGITFSGVSLLYLWKIVNTVIIQGQDVNPITFLIFIFLFTGSFQSFSWAMWMDIQDNEHLYIR